MGHIAATVPDLIELGAVLALVKTALEPKSIPVCCSILLIADRVTCRIRAAPVMLPTSMMVRRPRAPGA
jgi:hypothetical protein